MLLYALSTTFLAAALVAATPATVYQRQTATPSIALNNSAYPSSYRVFLTDTSLSESGPQSCDRFKYLIAVNLPLANVWTDTKFRGLIGQARYGPQGAILDNIFVDYNYALFDRAYPDSTPLANTTFYFQAEPTLFYAKDPAKALRKQPWSLSKQNTSEGYVVPGQYVVAVVISNDTAVNTSFALGSNITASKNCTDAYSGKGDGSHALKVHSGLLVSAFLWVSVVLFLSF